MRMLDDEFADLDQGNFTSWPVAFRNALAEARRARDREAALEVKCDLLSASLKKADARGLESERAYEAAKSERDALRAEVERLREMLREFVTEVSKAAYAPQLEHLGPLVLDARAALAHSEPKGEQR